MIVRIKLQFPDGETLTRMFGDSYKSWHVQFAEYCMLNKPIEILEIETSPEKWISWGGLKWCSESDFQHELNREGCQRGEPDNPTPRQYHKMRFGSNRIAANVANKILRRIIKN